MIRCLMFLTSRRIGNLVRAYGCYMFPPFFPSSSPVTCFRLVYTVINKSPISFVQYHIIIYLVRVSDSASFRQTMPLAHHQEKGLGLTEDKPWITV